MTAEQDHTRSQLHEWVTAEATGVHDITHRPQDCQARNEYVMDYDPARRLLAASDTIDEVLDWNSGRGHLIVTGPGLPESALNALTLLGFARADIESVLADRIDEHGNLTTKDIVEATADLAGVAGTEDTFLRTVHDRATSDEAVHDAEHAAYHDEFNRVSELPVSDLIAETGHADLDSALQSVAEHHGFATFADLDTALSDYWDESSHQLYASLSTTETTLWAAADRADAEAAFGDQNPGRFAADDTTAADQDASAADPSPAQDEAQPSNGTPPADWVSEHGDWTQVRGGGIHYHPNHPGYYDSDDAQIDGFYQQYEAGEAAYIRDHDHDTAVVLDQFRNESPGADTSTLLVWDRNDMPISDGVDDDIEVDEL